MELDAAKDLTTTTPWTKYNTGTKVGEGLCQPREGYIVWDLKPLDQSHEFDYIGAGEEGFGGNTFAVEMCESA
jgi:hypothetical protein